jgi:hypothetical protein
MLSTNDVDVANHTLKLNLRNGCRLVGKPSVYVSHYTYYISIAAWGFPILADAAF